MTFEQLNKKTTELKIELDKVSRIVSDIDKKLLGSGRIELFGNRFKLDIDASASKLALKTDIASLQKQIDSLQTAVTTIENNVYNTTQNVDDTIYYEYALIVG